MDFLSHGGHNRPMSQRKLKNHQGSFPVASGTPFSKDTSIPSFSGKEKSVVMGSSTSSGSSTFDSKMSTPRLALANITNGEEGPQGSQSQKSTKTAKKIKFKTSNHSSKTPSTRKARAKTSFKIASDNLDVEKKATKKAPSAPAIP
eukprot:TRINITY_DN18910_c0_g1_i1.p1 TRINITY_DN18910_c0_g1~~TRINITY_DN18910_c0_g1_i1.p1  ORF type:complete len:161 (+),score=42.76 TRINITY_DN18910_c0_g1_i1:48-485(+)